jgi:hypothetical protein
MDDPESVMERKGAEQDLRKAEKALNALRALRHEIAPHRRVKEERVFGSSPGAPPIFFLTEYG